MGLYMENTRIEAEDTIASIEKLLRSTGLLVRSQKLYEDGDVAAFYFEIQPPAGESLAYTLPARVRPVFEYLQRQRSPKFRERGEEKDREQAVRVAWRQVLRWIQAQLAMIETGMVDVREVFLPYLVAGDGRTLYETLRQRLDAGVSPHRLLEVTDA